MNRKRLILLCAAVALAGGCSLAPEYRRPAAPVPDGWPAGAPYGETAPAPAARRASELPWRAFFTDARLQAVIAIALDHNRDLRLAALNVDRMRALYGIQRAEILPTVHVAGSGSRERIPADLSSSRSAMTSERYSASLGISAWEIDFFGRIRSLRDRALEEYLATEQARRSAQILIVSSVAQAYLSLAADRSALKLVVSTLEAQEASYRLTRKSLDAGLASRLDLSRAQSQVDAARGEVARYTRLAAQAENALNLLAGSPVPQELMPAELAVVRPPGEIAAGLSSELLLDRPDIAAAEHRLRAANANIGAARAAFFPRISLTTAIGTASADLSGLFKDGSGTWGFAPLIAVPVFDARTWSAYEVTKTDREIAVAQYEKAIQTAFREVADTLVARGAVEQQIAAQQALVEAAAEANRLAHLRFTGGIDSYLGVLDAQRSLYAAQQALIALRLARLANEVTLYKVLGGGA